MLFTIYHFFPNFFFCEIWCVSNAPKFCPGKFAAGFQIIKRMLPAEAVGMIKFLKKSNNNEFVTEDQRLVSWGGESVCKAGEKKKRERGVR